MKFGPVPVAQALGAVLAHSMPAHQTTPEGPKTQRIAKGTILSDQHLEALARYGHEHLTVAQLEAGDISENDAALRLAQALVPEPEAQGITLSRAGAGRVNLHAQGPGLVQLKAQQIAGLNAVDPMITVATVPDYHRTDARSMIATIKIISYAVPATSLEQATSQAAHALRVCSPRLHRATLIETRIDADIPPDKGRTAIEARLTRMNAKLDPRVVVPHDEAALAQALGAARGELILILTGSATSDVQDVAPSALRRAGGQVTRFGMPVDPGNLLFLGDLGGRPVIGLPGCARSVALNGADWVLERLLCGLSVSSADIAAMGVGGLLKEIPTRPHPRAARSR